MMRATILMLSLLPGFAAVAAQPSPAAGLEARSPGEWLSYDVALQPGTRGSCCFDWRGRRTGAATCRLADSEWNTGHRDSDPAPAQPARLRVLLRRAASGFDRVLAVGTQCAIDADGVSVVDVGAVDAGASVDLLESAFEHGRSRRSAALAAIAQHAGAQADRSLQAAAATNRPHALRRDAAFWLGHARGEVGYRAVRAMIDTDPDDDVRRHAVFALGQSPLPMAAQALRQLAVEHALGDIRAEAIFWLAQEADPEVERLVAEALARDGTRAVREKAVFALSQLPESRAIPALRDLIERGATREIRKDALFWLAQVDDDAVLPVFDELLGD